jgi:hypothetical protein
MMGEPLSMLCVFDGLPDLYQSPFRRIEAEDYFSCLLLNHRNIVYNRFVARIQVKCLQNAYQ